MFFYSALANGIAILELDKTSVESPSESQGLSCQETRYHPHQAPNSCLFPGVCLVV